MTNHKSKLRRLSAWTATALALFLSGQGFAQTLARAESYVGYTGYRSQGKTGIILIGDKAAVPCGTEMSKRKFIEAGRAIKERMVSDFEEGNFDPSVYAADVAVEAGYTLRDVTHGPGVACLTYFSYLPILHGYVEDIALTRNLGKPAGWVEMDAPALKELKELKELIVTYLQKNGISDVETAWAGLKEKTGWAWNTDEEETALKEYFGYALYPAAVSGYLQETAYTALKDSKK
jgi:hypothetical protein